MPDREITVLGSLNIDLVQRVDRLPAPGETVTGSELQLFCGGKGANQACAAARAGGRVSMAGMVGADVFGARLKQELEAAGANVSRVEVSSRSTGAASILVLPTGENVIVLSPGANATVSVPQSLAVVERLGKSDFLLCQLEIPLVSVQTALAAAHGKGVTTILDPAPGQHLGREILQHASIVTPNQVEAALLLGQDKQIESLDDARAAANAVALLGPGVVIVKMGALGCVVADGRTTAVVPGFAVKAVDSTGAGDTFNGALAVALAEGADLHSAARFANAAAALSVTAAGAMRSMPLRAAIDDLLRQVPVSSIPVA